MEEIVGNEMEVAVFWSPPIAELLVLNGSVAIERTISSTGQNYEPGDLFPVGRTQVEYRYSSEEAEDESCTFIVNVGKYILHLIYCLRILSF